MREQHPGPAAPVPRRAVNAGIDDNSAVLPYFDHSVPARWRTGFRCHCLGSNHRLHQAGLLYVKASGSGRNERRHVINNERDIPWRLAVDDIARGASNSPTRSEVSRHQTSAAVGPRQLLAARSEYCSYGRP